MARMGLKQKNERAWYGEIWLDIKTTSDSVTAIFYIKNDMVLLKPLFLLCKIDRAMLVTFSADDTSNEKDVRNIKQKQRPKRNAFGNNVFTSYDAKTKRNLYGFCIL